MKKALSVALALIGLCGVAAAESVTTTYTPLTELERSDWTVDLVNTNKTASTLTADKAAGSITFTSANNNTYNWNRSYAEANLSESITLNSGDSLNISFTLTHSANFGNQLIYLSFMGSGDTFTLGYERVDKADASRYALSSSISDTFRGSTDWNGTLTTDNTDTTRTFSGTLAINESNQLTFTTGENTLTLASDVTSFSISALNFGINCDKNTTTTLSNLTLTLTSEAIPEPATATLSLLALAGLAARRRRR